MTVGVKQGEVARASEAARPRIDVLWFGASLVSAALIAVAAFQPLWKLTLNAPQYPNGVRLTAYGSRMEGDLQEINALNHYVGIPKIDPASIVELRLFPFVIAGLVALLVVGAVFARHRWQRALIAVAAWGLPIGFLADLQWWLYRYGHDLHEDAPIRLDPFTPRVLGATKIVNFDSDAAVTAGFWMMIAAAMLVSVGPWAVRFVRDSWNNTGDAAGRSTSSARVAVLAISLLAGAAALSPRTAQAQDAPPISIAAAIAAAPPGGTVVIPAGTYHGALVIDRPVVLVGEGQPVIDGGGEGDVVRITAEGVTLRGFDIRHSARIVTGEPAGIRVQGDGATLEDNRLEDVLYGIVLDESDGHLVRGNYVSSVLSLPAERRGHAIYVWYSADNLIEDNTVKLAKDGIFLGFATDTVVQRNRVTDLRYGLHTMYAHGLVLRDNVFTDNVAGASLMYSRDVVVEGNEFSENRSPASGYGILFKDMDDVSIINNRIHHNRLGLTVDGAPATPGAFVTLERNLIAFNTIALQLFTTTDMTFVENSFIGNVQQVESLGGSLETHNRWSLDGRGNYWDDYEGYDANGDGVGDLPYRYEGVFDDLTSRSEAVRAYAFTPARGALDLAARWFPIYRPTPRVVDEAPLMTPVIRFAGAQAEGPAVGAALASLALVALAVAVFGSGVWTVRARWRAC